MGVCGGSLNPAFSLNLAFLSLRVHDRSVLIGLNLKRQLNRISPWLAVLVLVGVASFLAQAWMNGASSPYKSPEDLRRSNDAMQQNDVSTTDPAESYKQSMAATAIPHDNFLASRRGAVTI